MSKLIYINAGHGIGTSGKYDPGAIGPTGLREADVTSEVSWRLGNLLRAKGYRTAGQDHPRIKRVSYVTAVKEANAAGADIAIALHCNSATTASAHGAEVWYHRDGKRLAECLLRQITRQINDADRIPDPKQPWHNWLPGFLGTLVSRGVKEEGFYFVRATNMPAVLPEMAFISNRTEEAWLKRPTLLQQMAQAIADGVDDYFKGR